MKIALITSSIILSFAVLYCITFLYFWNEQPRERMVASGKPVIVVNFQYNRFTWFTEIIWRPAFKFMENVIGYEYLSMAAGSHDSIVTYVKPE
jgi:hypothetical protein